MGTIAITFHDDTIPSGKRTIYLTDPNGDDIIDTAYAIATEIRIPTGPSANNYQFDRQSSIRHDQEPTHDCASIIMGSQTDWPTMRPAYEILAQLEIKHEIIIVSAHRTPDLMAGYAKQAEERGIEVIIAGAGGAAHLPGMVASYTDLPVLGVPVPSTILNGQDSLLSIIQMPKGTPVGALAIGQPGAWNAGLLAARILARKYPTIRTRVHHYRHRLAAEAEPQTIIPDAQ